MSEVLRNETRLSEELKLGLLSVSKHISGVEKLDDMFKKPYVYYKKMALEQHLRQIKELKQEEATHIENPVVSMAARLNTLEGIEQYITQELDECKCLLELYDADEKKEVGTNEKATA